MRRATSEQEGHTHAASGRRFQAMAFCVLFALGFPAGMLAQAAPRPASGPFRLALPGYEFAFPRDHGSHDDYRTEWWYYTGQVTTAKGRRYGFEVTFFRVGVTPPSVEKRTEWDLRNLSLAHFAITDPDRKDFRYYEKLNRSSRYTAHAVTGMLDVFNESWRASTMPDGAWHLVAQAGGDSINLVLRSHKEPAVHGENGISVKAAGIGYASHYYSMTRLEVSGSISTRGSAREACSGLAWMDHEFGSAALRETQQGWDWFSIQLNDESELMLYQIRRRNGSPDASSSGSFISSDGTIIHIRNDQMKIEPASRWTSKRTRATYPMGWRVSVPSLGIVLDLTPWMQNQELITTGSTGVTYWEGAVDVQGSSVNGAVKGGGYVEMTGYDRPFQSP